MVCIWDFVVVTCFSTERENWNIQKSVHTRNRVWDVKHYVMYFLGIREYRGFTELRKS